MTRRPCELGIKGKGLHRSCGYCWPSGLFQPSLSVVALQTSSRKYSSSSRLLYDPFINPNVGPANNSGVRVSILSRFITNAEKFLPSLRQRVLVPILEQTCQFFSRSSSLGPTPGLICQGYLSSSVHLERQPMLYRESSVDRIGGLIVTLHFIYENFLQFQFRKLSTFSIATES
ncbi:hypothetical protein Tco_0500838 [Tanacetum coccineum]